MIEIAPCYVDDEDMKMLYTHRRKCVSEFENVNGLIYTI